MGGIKGGDAVWRYQWLAFEMNMCVGLRQAANPAFLADLRRNELKGQRRFRFLTPHRTTAVGHSQLWWRNGMADCPAMLSFWGLIG